MQDRVVRRKQLQQAVLVRGCRIFPLDWEAREILSCGRELIAIRWQGVIKYSYGGRIAVSLDTLVVKFVGVV